MAQACAVSAEARWSKEKLMEDKASSKGGSGGTPKANPCGSSDSRPRSSKSVVVAGGKQRESASGSLTLEAIRGRLQELEELVRIQAAKDGPTGCRETGNDYLGERGGLGMLGSDESEQKKGLGREHKAARWESLGARSTQLAGCDFL